MAEPIPPPYVISATDKRGLVVVITATTLSFVWTCLLIRIWLRYKTREWKSDDYFLAGATVLDTVQSGLVFHIVEEGLGKSQESLSDLDLRQIGKDDFASQILYILTLFLSKCAVLFLYLRLSPRRDHAIASWATIALSAAWAISSTALVAASCNMNGFWNNGIDKCPGIGTRWAAISAIDIIIEACIFFISVYLVARLNMRTKSKVMVVTAFSARLPVIAAAGIRLYYLEATFSSQNRSLEAAYYFVATQWHLGYAIMSSTITGLGPFLRPFGNSYSTSYRRSSNEAGPSNPASSFSKSDPDYRSESRTQKRAVSYQMTPIQAREVSILNSGDRKLSSPTRDTFASTSQAQILPQASPLQLRPDMSAMRRDTTVYGGQDVEEDDAVSQTSNESRRMIITKKTELRVETDRRSVASRNQSRGNS